MRLDFEGVDRFSILPEGPYVLTIDEYDEGVTKSGANAGSPMLILDFKNQETGVSFRQWFPAVPKAMWKIQQLLEAATGRDWKSNSMEVDGQVLLGRTVGAMVSIGLNNKNQKVNNVDQFMSPDELPNMSDYNNASADFLSEGSSPDPRGVSVPSNPPDDNFDF